jgi:hypothetical protein
VSRNQLFFCVAAGLLLVIAVLGSLIAPRAPVRPGDAPRRRGTMPGWAVAFFGLALASFALALEMPRLAVMAALPFLLPWLLEGARSARVQRPVAAAATAAVAGVIVPAASAAPAGLPAQRVPGDFEMIDPPEPPPARRPREASSPAWVGWVGLAIEVVIFRRIPRAEGEPDDGSAEFARERAMDSLVVTILCALFAYGLFRMGRGMQQPGMVMFLAFIIPAGLAAVGPFVTLRYAILWLARR